MLNRCEGSVDAVETPLGYEPKAEDIDTNELDIEPEVLGKLLRVDKEIWKEEIAGIEEFYSQFEWLPEEITENLDRLKAQIS